jgi:four helix bundle protein
MKRIEDLDVYKYSYELIIRIYEVTKSFPSDEKFGLTSQMRRSAVSICSNMSEGGARISKGEQKQFLGIALGSVAELRLHISLSKNIGFIDEEVADDLIDKIDIIHKMLTGLINK